MCEIIEWTGEQPTEKSIEEAKKTKVKIPSRHDGFYSIDKEFLYHFIKDKTEIYSLQEIFDYVNGILKNIGDNEVEDGDQLLKFPVNNIIYCIKYLHTIDYNHIDKASFSLYQKLD